MTGNTRLPAHGLVFHKHQIPRHLLLQFLQALCQLVQLPDVLVPCQLVLKCRDDALWPALTQAILPFPVLISVGTGSGCLKGQAMCLHPMEPSPEAGRSVCMSTQNRSRSLGEHPAATAEHLDIAVEIYGEHCINQLAEGFLPAHP